MWSITQINTPSIVALGRYLSFYPYAHDGHTIPVSYWSEVEVVALWLYYVAKSRLSDSSLHMLLPLAIYGDIPTKRE